MSLTEIDYKKLFPFPDRPLEVEIGFGWGRFLSARSQRNPNSNYIGIEPDEEVVTDFIQDNINATNIKIILYKANYVVKKQFPKSYVNRYWLFNPEHYALDTELQYIDTDFCNAIIESLEPNGILNIVTHYKWYSEELMRYFGRLTPTEPFIPDEQHKTVWEINNQARLNFIRMAFKKEE